MGRKLAAETIRTIGRMKWMPDIRVSGPASNRCWRSATSPTRYGKSPHSVWEEWLGCGIRQREGSARRNTSGNADDRVRSPGRSDRTTRYRDEWRRVLLRIRSTDQSTRRSSRHGSLAWPTSTLATLPQPMPLSRAAMNRGPHAAAQWPWTFDEACRVGAHGVAQSRRLVARLRPLSGLLEAGAHAQSLTVSRSAR